MWISTVISSVFIPTPIVKSLTVLGLLIDLILYDGNAVTESLNSLSPPSLTAVT